MKKIIFIITIIFIIGNWDTANAIDCGLPYNLEYGMSKYEAENKLKKFPTKRKNNNIEWSMKPECEINSDDGNILRAMYITISFENNKLTGFSKKHFFSVFKHVKLYPIIKLSTNHMKTLISSNLNNWTCIGNEKNIKITEKKIFMNVFYFINKNCKYSSKIIGISQKFIEDNKRRKWILFTVEESIFKKSI